MIARFLSLREDGYIAKYSDKLFRLMGFGALNYYLKMFGFFMIVIAPFILVIVSVLFPTPPDGKFASGEIKGKPILRSYEGQNDDDAPKASNKEKDS